MECFGTVNMRNEKRATRRRSQCERCERLTAGSTPWRQRQDARSNLIGCRHFRLLAVTHSRVRIVRHDRHGTRASLQRLNPRARLTSTIYLSPKDTNCGHQLSKVNYLHLRYVHSQVYFRRGNLLPGGFRGDLRLRYRKSRR